MPASPRQTPESLKGSSGLASVVEWPDEEDTAFGKDFKKLSAQEAQALRDRDPSVSVWTVVAVQALVGLLIAVVAGAVAEDRMVFWSALYGAGAVVIPAVLMARGMTSRLSSASPGVSAVSFMLWELVKIGVSVGLLMLAYRIVVPLSWPALLLGLVVCIKVYWVALAWRGRSKNSV